MYPQMFSSVAAAATKAGLADKLTKQTFKETIFLPTNMAFKASGIDLEKADKVCVQACLCLLWTTALVLLCWVYGTCAWQCEGPLRPRASLLTAPDC
jgi:hypothetical protein